MKTSRSMWFRVSSKMRKDVVVSSKAMSPRVNNIHNLILVASLYLLLLYYIVLKPFFRKFSGLQGTRIYEEFQEKKTLYVAYILQKKWERNNVNLLWDL